MGGSPLADSNAAVPATGKNALTAVFQRKAFNMHREEPGWKRLSTADYQEGKTRDIQLKKVSLGVKNKNKQQPKPQIAQLTPLTRTYIARGA